MSHTLEQLKLVSPFTQLPNVLYRHVSPTPLPHPQLVHTNQAVAQLLNLAQSELSRAEFVQLFSGHTLLNNMQPVAMKYAGHQFGIYNPHLGDGRGLLMGQVQDQNKVIWDLHLKGAGKTPFSRQGDGRAVLRSSIREYLCSEAMHHLGIPTTRALCLISGDEPVKREQVETAAMLVRVSKSHIRFGHFEYLYHSNQHQLLAVLADSLIQQHWPDLAENTSPYQAMFERIIEQTAQLIAKWQAVGFCHGVMNTDNMSILGETFDYGPFAFLQRYQADYVCNSSDYEGRYAFNRQGDIALWNLTALAYALTPIISHDELNQSLEKFEPQLIHHYRTLMLGKLGLAIAQPQDGDLIRELLQLMATHHVDYSTCFRRLSQCKNSQQMQDLFNQDPAFTAWFNRYLKRACLEHINWQQRQTQMCQVNPKYILRNHLLQQAIAKAEQGDYQEMARLFNLLAHPFDEQPGSEYYAMPAPAGSPQMPLSCSS
ncbi:protein adenylyltransferase SelO [Motilimonas sp. KMU-193]|uniref:protein adenylyltransferase SelO n=1 Tax=Motilimonas sp. KMU-193 TaxID=3388668 RepID=UPI00396B20B3